MRGIAFASSFSPFFVCDNSGQNNRSTASMMRRSVARLSFLDLLKYRTERAGSFYDPKSMTSKDNTMRQNMYDPVYNGHLLQKVLGPLRRKADGQSNFLHPEEAEKWMEVSSAAKVLGISDSALKTLTKADLEKHWAHMFKQQNGQSRDEVSIAMEVLLEYLDSEMYQQKNKQFYKDYVQKVRLSADDDRRARNEVLQGYAMTIAACFVAIAVGALVGSMYFLGTITGEEVKKIGTSAKHYFAQSINQAPNLEPPPDYSIRYRDTPTAVDVADAVLGGAERRLLDPVTAKLLKEKEDRDRDEDALTVQLINMENERQQRLERERILMESTVVIHRAEDYDSEGRLRASTSAATAAAEENAAKRSTTEPSLYDRAWGVQTPLGGSRLQRIFRSASEAEAARESMERRIRMVDPHSIELAESRPQPLSAFHDASKP